MHYNPVRAGHHGDVGNELMGHPVSHRGYSAEVLKKKKRKKHNQAKHNILILFGHMFSFSWYFENIRTLCHSLLLLCKYAVSTLQHITDSLHVDNTVNDTDLLYCVVCYALSPWVYSRGKLFACIRVYNHMEALAVGQPLLWPRLNQSHIPHLNL